MLNNVTQRFETLIKRFSKYPPPTLSLWSQAFGYHCLSFFITLSDLFLPKDIYATAVGLHDAADDAAG